MSSMKILNNLGSMYKDVKRGTFFFSTHIDMFLEFLKYINNITIYINSQKQAKPLKKLCCVQHNFIIFNQLH